MQNAVQFFKYKGTLFWYNRTNIIHNMTTPVPQRLKYILHNVED
jgi:hypothetical protein